ncbi:MAG TPA: DMT family transporter [Ardenticatenaceae bacterium]|nr:DMT family transporter [Ardenticatenaceae bacterium]
MRDSRPGARWLPLFAAILWGTSFPLVQVALRDLSPLQIAFLRAVLGSLSMGAVLWFQGEIPHPRTGRGWLQLFVVALIGTGIFWPLQNLAVARSTAVNAAFLTSTYPALVVILAPLVAHRPLHRRALAGSFVALAGAYLIISGGRLLDLFASKTLVGDLLALLASLLAGLYILLVEVVDPQLGIRPSALTFFTFALSLPVLALVAARDPLPTQLHFDSLAALLWLGVMTSTVAYLALTAGVASGGAASSAIQQMVTPLVAALLTWLLFGTTLTPVQWAGALLVLAGIFLETPSSRSQRH